MLVSVVATVKNEEDTVAELLESMLTQSRAPDEIVIVDGGSTDGTVETINDFVGKGAPINLIVAPGANIPVGRNLAIKNAKGDIIACTDAGTRLHVDWLRNLVSKFDNKTSVVSGIFLPYEHGDLLQRCIGKIFFPKERFKKATDDTFLPSSRSVAFRKAVWEEVGGYPEFLDTAEDTVFCLRIREAGHRFKLAKNAIVYWGACEGFRDLIVKVFTYSKNDVKAKILLATWKPNVRRFAIFVSFLMLLALSFLFWWGIPLFALFIVGVLAFPAYLGFKVARRLDDVRAIFMVPMIIFVVDFARLLGLLYGLIRYKLWRIRN